MIKSCKCSSEFQDAKYGKGQRVHNTTLKGSRCTSCGSDKTEKSK